MCIRVPVRRWAVWRAWLQREDLLAVVQLQVAGDTVRKECLQELFGELLYSL